MTCFLLLLLRFDESVAAFAVTLPAGGTAAAMAAQPADTDAMPAVTAAPAASATAAASLRERQGGAAAAAGQQRQEFFLHPATVRRNDTSAAAIDEWTVPPSVPFVLLCLATSCSPGWSFASGLPSCCRVMGTCAHLRSICVGATGGAYGAGGGG